MGRRRKDRVINAKTGDMQAQAYKDQIMEDGSKRTMRKVIIPRRDTRMVPGKGGGNFRVSEKVRYHDNNRQKYGITKKWKINEEGKQPRLDDKRRWKTGDKIGAKYKRTKQRGKTATRQGRGRCRSRKERQTRPNQRRQRWDGRMA